MKERPGRIVMTTTDPFDGRVIAKMTCVYNPHRCLAGYYLKMANGLLEDARRFGRTGVRKPKLSVRFEGFAPAKELRI